MAHRLANSAVRPVIEVRDRNNLPVAGALVTFSIEGGKAAVTGLTPSAHLPPSLLPRRTRMPPPLRTSTAATLLVRLEGARTIAGTFALEKRETSTNVPESLTFIHVTTGSFPISLRKTP